MLKVKMTQNTNDSKEVLWRFELMEGMQQLPDNTNFAGEGYFDCQRAKMPAYQNPMMRIGFPDVAAMRAAFEQESGLQGRAEWYMVDQGDNLILVSDEEHLKRVMADYVAKLADSFSYGDFFQAFAGHYSCIKLEGAALSVVQETIVEWIKGGALAINGGNSILNTEYKVNNPQLF